MRLRLHFTWARSRQRVGRARPASLSARRPLASMLVIHGLSRSSGALDFASAAGNASVPPFLFLLVFVARFPA